MASGIEEGVTTLEEMPLKSTRKCFYGVKHNIIKGIWRIELTNCQNVTEAHGETGKVMWFTHIFMVPLGPRLVFITS